MQRGLPPTPHPQHLLSSAWNYYGLNVGKKTFQPVVNISDVGFFSSPCRGVHYGAGVISLCVCGQRLVYLAERTVIPGTSPPWFLIRADEQKKKEKCENTGLRALCQANGMILSLPRLSALGLLCHTCALINFDDLRGQFCVPHRGEKELRVLITGASLTHWPF